MRENRIKVLLVEDNQADVELLQRMINRVQGFQFDLSHIGRLDEALKHLQKEVFDVILLDLGLPDSKGMDTFFSIYKNVSDVPVVVLTVLDDETLGVQAVQEGAQDYLVKGQVDGNLMVRSISYAIERKRVELELRESKELFSLFMDYFPGVVFIKDEKGKTLFINRHMKDTFGIGNWKDKTVMELFPRDVAMKMSSDDKKALFIGYEITEENVPDKKGEEHSYQTLKFRIDRGEKPPLLGGISIDISERKRAEKSLRDSEAFNFALFEYNPIETIVVNREGKVVKSNLAKRKSKGRLPNIGDLMYTDYADGHEIDMRAVLMESIREGKTKTFPELKYKKKFLSIDISPFPDGAIITSQDITEQKVAEKAVLESYKKLQSSLMNTVNALASTVEKRDPFTSGHQQRVTRLACAIAERMGLSKDQIDGLRIASLLHDIGKVSVPAEILSKPSRLTDDEFTLIKKHPQIAYEVLENIEFPWPVAQIVLQHHEKLDGSGYPMGISGNEILLEARILIISDIVEALSSHRPYRPAFEIEKALNEVSKGRGILYDTDVVNTCIELFKSKTFREKWN